MELEEGIEVPAHGFYFGSSVYWLYYLLSVTVYLIPFYDNKYHFL